jgi:hypothetical protein
MTAAVAHFGLRRDDAFFMIIIPFHAPKICSKERGGETNPTTNTDDDPAGVSPVAAFF